MVEYKQKESFLQDAQPLLQIISRENPAKNSAHTAPYCCKTKPKSQRQSIVYAIVFLSKNCMRNLIKIRGLAEILVHDKNLFFEESSVQEREATWKRCQYTSNSELLFDRLRTLIGARWKFMKKTTLL